MSTFQYEKSEWTYKINTVNIYKKIDSVIKNGRELEN